MSICLRCVKPLRTGDKYATEKRVDKLGREYYEWYHFNCIKNDPNTLKNVEFSDLAYVDHNPAPEKKDR